MNSIDFTSKIKCISKRRKKRNTEGKLFEYKFHTERNTFFKILLWEFEEKLCRDETNYRMKFGVITSKSKKTYSS